MGTEPMLNDVGTFLRFWKKVNVLPSDCWEWTAVRNPRGYGQFRVGPTMQQAHRYAYQYFVEALPPFRYGRYGRDELDHLCRNRWCVNPDHLELVEHKENAIRGVGPTSANARKTHCVHGHEFTEENTRKRKNGGRDCLACINSEPRKSVQRACAKAYRQTEAGRKKSRESSNRYGERHREEKRAYAKAYREKNRELVKAANKAWREKNREALLAKMKAYYQSRKAKNP